MLNWIFLGGTRKVGRVLAELHDDFVIKRFLSSVIRKDIKELKLIIGAVLRREFRDLGFIAPAHFFVLKAETGFYIRNYTF